MKNERLEYFRNHEIIFLPYRWRMFLRGCVCWLPGFYSLLRNWTYRTVLTDFLNELALIYEFAFLRGWCLSPCPPGLITGDAFSVCINCLGCFLISAAWPGLVLWGEDWKSFLGDERGLQQKAKIILNVIRQHFFFEVWEISLCACVCSAGGRDSPVRTRAGKCLSACVPLSVWLFPRSPPACVWSALWSGVRIRWVPLPVWVPRSPQPVSEALSGAEFASLAVASRSARSTVAKPSPRWPPASAPRRGAGGLSKLNSLYWYIHALRMFTAANWRLNLNILDWANSGNSLSSFRSCRAGVPALHSADRLWSGAAAVCVRGTTSRCQHRPKGGFRSEEDVK